MPVDKENNSCPVPEAKGFYKKEEKKKGVWIIISRFSEAVTRPPADSLHWELYSPLDLLKVRDVCLANAMVRVSPQDTEVSLSFEAPEYDVGT